MPSPSAVQHSTSGTRIGDAERPLGRLGLGCWAFGGEQWGGQAEADSHAALDAAIAGGITHLDTARAYGNGASERVLRPFLDRHRDRVFLATKGNAWNADPAELRHELEASLHDLGVDHVDLYYLHWPKSDADMKPLLAAIEDARSGGLVRAIGVSNFSVEQMRDVSSVARVDAHQLGYSLLWRPAEEEVIPYCLEHGIAVVSYSSLAQGILTGKFGPDVPAFPAGDQRPDVALFDPDAWPHIHDAVSQMKRLADAEGQPLVNLAVQWVASRPGVASVLVGARNARQAQQNAVTLARPVSADTLEALTRISDEACRHLPHQPNIFGFNP